MPLVLICSFVIWSFHCSLATFSSCGCTCPRLNASTIVYRVIWNILSYMKVILHIGVMFVMNSKAISIVLWQPSLLRGPSAREMRISNLWHWIISLTIQWFISSSVKPYSPLNFLFMSSFYHLRRWWYSNLALVGLTGPHLYAYPGGIGWAEVVGVKALSLSPQMNPLLRVTV